jgi:hypothetical protein
MWTHLAYLMGWILLLLLTVPVVLFYLSYLLMCLWWWRREQLLWREKTESKLLTNKNGEPLNPHWSEKLSDLYQLRMYRSSGQVRQEYAQRALAEYERAYTLTSETNNSTMLGKLAMMAFEAEALDKARAYAVQSLQSVSHQPEYARGSTLHHGNLVLGRLALHSGEIAEAKKYLLRSGQTPGGPLLNTGGPNMMLAKELLQHHEEETVLEYFTLCAAFWKIGATKLKRWNMEVLKGQIPNFGRNLYY